MGFFDRLAGKKTSAQSASTPATPPAAPATPVASVTAGNLLPRLAAARERLDARDLAGALSIYEEILAAAGDRADILVTISGDLGSTGNVASIVELIAPRYDAERHGPAIGLNLIQAYLAVHNADAAQHVLDILFGLGRPELEERLHGFSNAIAELLLAPAPSSPAGAGGWTAAAAVLLLAKFKWITYM
jgi:thioredoxin-like negative regulator of GroEL